MICVSYCGLVMYAVKRLISLLTMFYNVLPGWRMTAIGSCAGTVCHVTPLVAIIQKRFFGAAAAPTGKPLAAGVFIWFIRSPYTHKQHSPRHKSHLTHSRNKKCDQSNHSPCIVFSYIPVVLGPTGNSGIQSANHKTLS